MDWVKWVQQQLSEQKLDAPPQAEIEKEVRKALYASHRIGYGCGTLDPRAKRDGVEWMKKLLGKSIIGRARVRRKMEIWDELCAIDPWRDKGDADGQKEKTEIKDSAETEEALTGEEDKKT